MAQVIKDGGMNQDVIGVDLENKIADRAVFGGTHPFENVACVERQIGFGHFVIFRQGDRKK